MCQRQSRRRGWGYLWKARSNGEAKARIFEALVPLTCHRCGRRLEVGDPFTRGRAGVRICWLCRPFRCDRPDA